MNYIDAALHIPDWPAMMEALGDATFSAAMPQVASSGAGVIYVRFTPVEADQWRGTPGVELLAETPYDPDTDTPTDAAARLEAIIRDDAEALAKWTAVRPLTPVDDPETGTTHTPAFFPAIVG